MENPAQNAIENDDLLQIAVGHSRFAKQWKTKQMLWSEILDKLSTTTRTRETYAQYKRMKKDDQARVKDVGGFVGGVLKEGKRKAGYVAWRSLITLDADFATPDLWNTVKMLFGNAIAMYTTHSHRPDKPKLRLVIPLARHVQADEYEALSRFIAAEIGIDYFDDTTYQPERLMYWPSTSEDGEYLFEYIDGPWMDPDQILSRYPQWKDVSTWPESSRAPKIRHKHAEKQGDPQEKPGIIGAFCRTYTIPDAIEKFLPDVYEACDIKNRYTYTEGSATAGLVVYDNEMFAFSHHGTDPISGLLCNAFDLVRIHKFGIKDEDVDEDTPVHKLPSYKEMSKFALEDKEVRVELAEGKAAEAKDDFDKEDGDWREQLQYSEKGSIQRTIHNAVLILRHDEQLSGAIGYDEFRRRQVLKRPTPWREIEKLSGWTDTDDAGLRHYLERNYGLKGRAIIDDAVSITMLENSYHPVRDYLDGLHWDGTPRIETMLIDYLGAEDTEYTREIARKWMAAAVARIRDPGCKFDNMLILVGDQGVGKSQFFTRLARRLDWFSDSMSRFDNTKDAMEQLAGKWIIEVGELSSMRRSEVEHVKTFLTKQEDAYRPSYGRRLETFPRQCIFGGSTNRHDFLQDATGNRRFWPVQVNNTDKLWKELNKQRVDQLWAEADVIYRLGEDLYITGEAERQAVEMQSEYTESGGKVGLAAEFLERKIPLDWEHKEIQEKIDWLNGFDFEEEPQEGDVLRDYISGIELFVECFGNRPEDYKMADAYEMTNILTVLGWKKARKSRRITGYGKQRMFTKLVPGQDK